MQKGELVTAAQERLKVFEQERVTVQMRPSYYCSREDEVVQFYRPNLLTACFLFLQCVTRGRGGFVTK